MGYDRGGWWRLGEPHLEVDFRHKIGSLQMEVRFSTSAAWTVLFGASGSGKSTILRVVAGLEKLQQNRSENRKQRDGEVAQKFAEGGLVRISGKAVEDTKRRLRVPSHKRRVRWAGQRAYLFPWMSVEANLAVGLGSSAERANEVARGLEGFHLTELRRKQVAELSGGEAQRVAVAGAAMAASGRLLLLDEPFTGMDVPVKDRLIEDLRIWREGSPVVSVTHDVGEAFSLKAEVLRVAEGRVTAQGPVDEVLADERRRLYQVLA